MKRLLAITFLSLFLLSATELHQLLKMPRLIEHYLEHSEVNEELSFWDYLCMHYASEKTEHEQDNQLPFKSHGEFSSHVVTISVAHQYPAISVPLHTEEKEFPIYQEFFLNHAYLSSIWQPPKFS